MTKTAAILAGTAILVGGCHSSKQSETWRRVTNAPHPAHEAGEEDRVYAADLHRLLLASHTPHKIVTAEFTTPKSVFQPGVGHRTVVVYRDDGRKGQNWWLMDERLTAPFWLPNEPLDRQISFYLARPVTVVNVSDFSDADHAKMILPPDQKPARRTGTTTIQRVDAHPEPAKVPKGSAPAKAPEKAKKPAAESKIVPTPTAKVVEKPVEKHDTKPESKAPPKVEVKPVAKSEKSEKPKEKAPANPLARPSMGTPGKPAEHTAKSAPAATEPPPKNKKPSGEAPKEDANAIKLEEKSAAKGSTKAVPTGKPASQPDLFGNGEPADTAKTAKPAEKKPVKPAVKAAPSGKPVAHPDLFNRPDGTPQATIIEDGAAKSKKDEASDKAKPEANAQKPNFFKRIFRRIFARHRAEG